MAKKHTAGELIYEALGEAASVRGNRSNVSFGKGTKSSIDTFGLMHELSLLTNDARSCEQCYRKCKDFIINTLREINYSPRLPGGNSSVAVDNTKVTTHIPYELKMLFWYMAYRAFELYDGLNDAQKEAWNTRASDYIQKVTKRSRRTKGISNQLFLDYMLKDSKGNAGYRFSKKTFQDFAMSPSRFYEALHYKDIKMVNTYAGEKKGHLGWALNYIVSFARDYDNFLDLFGGSGRATMVVPKVDGVDYYINEWNFANINYYEVLRDKELFKAFKEYFKEKQKELELLNSTPDKISSACKKASASLYQLSEKVLILYSGKSACLKCRNNKLQRCKLVNDVMLCRSIYKYNIGQEPTIEVWGKVLLDLDKNAGGIKSVFTTSKTLDDTFEKQVSDLCDLYMKGMENSSTAKNLRNSIESIYNLGFTEKEKWYLRECFKSKNIIEYSKLSTDDRIEWAFAFVYYNSFIGSGGSSMGKLAKDDGKIKRFINYNGDTLDIVHREFNRLRTIYNTDALYNLEFLIEDFMDKPSRQYEDYEMEIRSLRAGEHINFKNQGLINTLGSIKDKKTRNFRTLIYSDSPYLETVGYGTNGKKSNTANGNITSSSMSSLIEKLMLFASKNNDFIFSCRACISKSVFLAQDEKELTEDGGWGETLDAAGLHSFSDILKKKPLRSKIKKDYYADCFDFDKTVGEAPRKFFKKIVIPTFINNYSIYSNVFMKFKNELQRYNNVKLYVIVCLPLGDGKIVNTEDFKKAKEKRLSKHLKNLDVVEVFITSYKVPSVIPSETYDTEDNITYTLDAYTFDEFIKALREHSYMSAFASGWKLDVTSTPIPNSVYKKEHLTIHVPIEEDNQKKSEKVVSNLKVRKK